MKLSPEDSIAWIKKRKSIFPKMFDANTAITKREILDLMEAARWAPNHKLTQPWRFVVFMDKGIDSLTSKQIDLIQSSGMDSETIQNKIDKSIRKGGQCSAIAAIVMKRDQQRRVPEWEEMCAVACAVQNVLLHAESLELAGYWSTGSFTNHKDIRDFLSLGEKDIHLGWLFLGRPSADLDKKRVRYEGQEFVDFRTV